MDKVDRILDQWRAERPELDVEPMGTLGRLARLEQHLFRATNAVFAKHGLNQASFDVLATLRRSGPPFALTPSELIDWTMVSSGTMTNRLDRLEAAGLVERHKSAADGRSFSVALTEKGKAVIDAAITDHTIGQRRLVAALSETERQTLDRIAAKWLAVFE